MARKRLTFEQMKNDGREPQPTKGVECPHCGCGHMEAYRTSDMPTGSIRRYRKCRNCGKKFVTSTPPEKIVREVEPKPDDEEERPVLKVRVG